MSWGADAIQAIGQNSGAAGGGASAAGAGAAGAAQAGASSWAPNAAASKGESLAGFYDAVKKDIAQNNANRVDLPQQQAQAPQLPGIQQFARQPMMSQTFQFQQPPTITGYNL